MGGRTLWPEPRTVQMSLKLDASDRGSATCRFIYEFMIVPAERRALFTANSQNWHNHSIVYTHNRDCVPYYTGMHTRRNTRAYLRENRTDSKQSFLKYVNYYTRGTVSKFQWPNNVVAVALLQSTQILKSKISHSSVATSFSECGGIR